MPNNWKTYKLEKVATLQRGFDLPNTKRTEGNYPVIAASGFSTWHNEFKVKGPGVTTGRSGTLGQVHFVKGDFWPLNTSLWVKDFHGNDERFIYYFLKTLNFDEYNSGTSVPTLNRNDVHKLDVSIPDLTEQKTIASILSAIDDKIENNLAINKTLEEMAMALYKHWFVDFGPFQEGEFVESELGSIPKGWEVKKITDLIEVKDGTHDSPKRVEDGFYLITSKHIMTNSIDFSSAYKISCDDYIKINKRSLVEKGDILMTMIGTVGNFYFVNEDPNYVIKNLGLFKTSKSPLLKIYLFSFFNSKIGQEYIKSQMTGSTQQYVTLKTLRNFDIIVPDEQILEDYNHLANDYFEKILINIKENQTLTQLRDTILPKLISGEVRLKEFQES